MPILKPISGHGSTGGIRRYLEKGGRALARDLFNLSYDERDAGALGGGDLCDDSVAEFGIREGDGGDGHAPHCGTMTRIAPRRRSQ